MIVSMIQSTAWPGTGLVVGFGRPEPSRPVLPCTASAVTSGRTSGRIDPWTTGMSVRPASSHSFSALAVVSDSGTLPATVVRPAISSSGEPIASRMAMASSCPGSVSMMMRLVSAITASLRNSLGGAG